MVETSRTHERLGRLRREAFEASTFGLGMVAALLSSYLVAANTTDFLGFAVWSAVALVASAGLGWKYQRWGPAAGVALVLGGCWLLLSIAGAPGTTP